MDDDQAAFLSEGLPTYRTQHGMTRQEILTGIANRIMYSRFYKVLYLVMSLLSVISLVLSLREACPSGMFKFLEIVVNLAMVLEVSVRLVAMGTLYWRSYSNIFDVIVVSLCVVILIPTILFGFCTQGTTIMDTALLVSRNAVQSIRLFLMLRKNRRNLNARETTIDFADTRAPSMDFEDDDVPGISVGQVPTSNWRSLSPSRSLGNMHRPNGGYNGLV